MREGGRRKKEGGRRMREEALKSMVWAINKVLIVEVTIVRKPDGRTGV